jgi:hypothetical protein
MVLFVIFRGKNGRKFAKLFHGLSFGRTFFSFFSKVKVKVFSSCEFEFSFSTFGFGVGLKCKCWLECP